MASNDTQERLKQALTEFDEARRHHDDFVDKVERRYRVYDGFLDPGSTANQWNSKLHPPYVNHIVETGLAAYVDEQFKFKVLPRPRVAPQPDERDRLVGGARAFELLLARQLERARFDEIQRPFALQNDIAGLTVSKQFWDRRTRRTKALRTQHRPIPDLLGRIIGRVPQLVEVDIDKVDFDGPVAEVVDVRDFLWHEAAVSLDRSPYLFHRVWMTWDEVKSLENAGVYGKDAGGEPCDTLKESRSFHGEIANREQQLFDVDRTKDMIEVVEWWRQTPDGIKTLTFANRKTLLSGWRDNPFWHGQFPFVVCSGQSHLFRIPGKSRVEKLEQLQEMLWLVMNQRLDNLSLINNAIVLFNGDMVDIDDFEYAPLAQNRVDGPPEQAVQLWTPSPMPAEVSLPAEAGLKQDMQNISGSQPFTSTSEARSVDANTATEAALVTNLAQRSAKFQKMQFNLAYKRVGEQFLQLDQQFIREPHVEQLFGYDAEPVWMEILPEMLEGDFDFSVQPMTESMMRAERRAEANGLFQIATGAAQVMATIGAPLNLRAFAEDVLDAYDKPDKDRYFSAQPQQPPGQTQPAGEDAGQPEGPEGVTAPQSIDPAVSPSNQSSLSPAVFEQRARAMSGGVANVQ